MISNITNENNFKTDGHLFLLDEKAISPLGLPDSLKKDSPDISKIINDQANELKTQVEELNKGTLLTLDRISIQMSTKLLEEQKVILHQVEKLEQQYLALYYQAKAIISDLQDRIVELKRENASKPKKQT